MYINCTSQLGQEIKIVICIRQVSGSNSGGTPTLPIDHFGVCVSVYSLAFFFVFVWSMSYQRKVGDYFFPEVIIKILGGHTDGQTHRQKRELINLPLFFKQGK
jgi:hypothetical protein